MTILDMKSSIPTTSIPHLSNTKNVLNLRALKVTKIIFILLLFNEINYKNTN